MAGRKHKFSRMLVLLIAMAVLLPLLAAFQYHWLGQVSEGASERLQAGLRASANRFRQDFNREVIRTYANFHIDFFAPPADLERYHLDRLDRWNQTAPYPHLISEVFVVTYDEHDQPRLSRLNTNSKRLEASEWSGALQNWRERFVRKNAADQSTANGSRGQSLESIAADIPALIIPFPFVTTPPGDSASQPQPPGFTVVQLDLDYLKREFIPALVRRHLFDDSQEYNVAIVSSRNPERVIYASPNSTIDFASSDVSTPILGLEADEIRSFLKSEAGGSEPGVNRPVRLINLRLLRRSAIPAGNDGDSARAASATSAIEEDGRWQLLVKHHTGSLAAAVSSARYRNLAISFGILLLLAAGILMTAISTRRAERLALQQINFVAGVTHELRTPLAVICSAGDNLAHGIVETPEKVAQYGEVIHREGRRLTDLVEQVLEFAGAQSGRQRYDFRPTDLEKVIMDAIAACQTQFEEEEFKIETMIAPHLPPVNGDAGALRRAMQNLISNAVKYSSGKPENRWARISAQTSAGDQTNEVRVTVEDRGLGIDSTDLPHIFEPFYRGHGAVAAQIKGSGVGLSLVKQIVEAHGGRINVDSTRGVGSTFTIDLLVGRNSTRHKVAEDGR